MQRPVASFGACGFSAVVKIGGLRPDTTNMEAHKIVGLCHSELALSQRAMREIRGPRSVHGSADYTHFNPLQLRGTGC